MYIEKKRVGDDQETRVLRVIRCRVGEAPEAATIQPGSEAIRREVAGFFGEVELSASRITAYVNDDGERLGLPVNRTVITHDGQPRTIRGNFFLAIRTPKGTLVGFTPNQLQDLMQKIQAGNSGLFAAE